MSDTDLAYAGIAELAPRLHAREISPVELTRACLERIETLDKGVNAYLSGFPVVALPSGFDELGLPIGMQVAGLPWQERLLVQVAHAYQQATDWHRRRPRSSA